LAALPWRDPGPILRPRSVAIVGASPSSRWLQIFLEQIPNAGYRGALWLVNPSHAKIGDAPCYPSVRATPEVPEHLLVLLPAERVVPVLEEAAAAGVTSATVYATGWAETDHAGKARQETLRALVERTGLRVCGPNCLGTISVREGLIAYPLRVSEWLAPGGIGVVFQSGALLYPFVRAGGERGAGFSYLVSCGNEVGVDAADYVKFLVEDPETTAIALLLEGVKAPDKFRAALELALAAGKPVAVLKVGRTERAQASTLTHTGALSGSSRIFDALCRRYGVAQCDSLDELIESSRLLATGKRPAGRRTAVLLFSGSLRSQILDSAAEHGIELAEPAPATIDRLNTIAPLDLRITNPVDCGYVAATQAPYIELSRLILEDPGVDLLLVQEHAPDPKRNRSGAALRKLAAETSKPVIVLTETAFSRTLYTEQFLAEAGVLFMHGIDRGLKAVGHLIAHSEAVRRHSRTAPSEAPAAGSAAGPVPGAGALELGAGLHGLAAIGTLLESYGVPVAGWRMARSVDEAVAAADALGYPVVLKVESPDVAHKSDVGGVRLGLSDADAVRRAWMAMRADLARHAPAARIEGALVARMAAPGIEMSIGVQRDPQFGPALMVGLGGVWVEALGDVSLRLLPIDEAEAHAMLAELKAAPLLGAFRGAPPRDVQALAAAMLALSRLALDHAGQIVSVEVNPLLVHEVGRGVTAVDARLVLA
jgi:acyl-CoA synthetase (NDP forming)